MIYSTGKKNSVYLLIIYVGFARAKCQGPDIAINNILHQMNPLEHY